jgi:hypothetical protein
MTVKNMKKEAQKPANLQTNSNTENSNKETITNKDVSVLLLSKATVDWFYKNVKVTNSTGNDFIDMMEMIFPNCKEIRVVD